MHLQQLKDSLAAYPLHPLTETNVCDIERGPAGIVQREILDLLGQMSQYPERAKFYQNCAREILSNIHSA